MVYPSTVPQSTTWHPRLPVAVRKWAKVAATDYAALAIFIPIVLCAFRYPLGGRPLLTGSRLDD